MHLAASDSHGPQFRVRFIESAGVDSYPECLTNGRTRRFLRPGDEMHYSYWVSFFSGHVTLDLELDSPLEVQSLTLAQMDGATFDQRCHRHHGCEGRTSRVSSAVTLLAEGDRGAFRPVGGLQPFLLQEEGSRRMWEFRFSGPPFTTTRVRLAFDRPEDPSAPTMIDQVELNETPNDAFLGGVWRYQRDPPAAPQPQDRWSVEEYLELTGQHPYRRGECPVREALAGPGIASRPDWLTKRRDLVSRYVSLFGSFPTRTCRPSAELIMDEVREDIRWRKLILNVGPGSDPFLDRMPLYLLTPAETSGPVPTVIALHPTVYGAKDEAVGLDGYAARDFSGIVRQGFALVSPDAVTFGDRCQDADPRLGYSLVSHGLHFYRRYPKWSWIGKMAWDTSRLIDYLETLREIDAGRIGVVGFSHGSYHTLFSAIQDERIRALVISGMPPELYSEVGVQAWGKAWGCFPRLLLYEQVPECFPLDREHLLSLVAPRPVMILPECGVLDLWRETVDEKGVRAVYDLDGAGHRVTVRRRPYSHLFLEGDRAQTMEFFSENLGRQDRKGEDCV